MRRSLRLRMIALLLLLFVSKWARAHVAKDCDAEALPAVKAVVDAVRVCLREQILGIPDVRHMIARTGMVQDPFGPRTRDIGNVEIRKRVAARIARLKPEHMATAHQALGEVIGASAQNQADIQSASERTADVFNPKEVRSFAQPLTKTFSSPSWFTTQDGDLRLVLFSLENAHLKIFDPQDPKALFDKELRPEFWSAANRRGQTIVFPHGNGQLLLMHRYDDTKELMLHDVMKDKTVLSTLPHTVESVALARGKDREKYMIIRASDAIYTYSVGADLKLREISRKPMKARLLHVTNSADGRILITAVVKEKSVYVFDPLTREWPREHSARDAVSAVQGVFTPSGDSFVVLRTEAPGDGDVAYEFLTSKSAKTFRSRVFSNKTVAGEWFITKDGHPLLPVRHNDDQMGHFIYVYDPSRPKYETKFGGVFGFLEPDELAGIYKVDGGTDVGTGRPALFETPQGQIHIVEGVGVNHEIRLKVFDPVKSYTAIHEIPLDGTDVVQTVRVGFFPEAELFYYMVLRGHPSRTPFQIHTGMESAHLSLTGVSEIFSPVAEDKNANYFVAGITFSDPGTRSLQLYRLTTKTGEDADK